MGSLPLSRGMSSPICELIDSATCDWTEALACQLSVYLRVLGSTPELAGTQRPHLAVFMSVSETA